MLRGLLIVNAFLRTTKFDELYHILQSSAQTQGMLLDVKTNAELCGHADASLKQSYDFVLFWDKDVQLAMQLEALGMPVFNSAQSILSCDDKGLTYLCLQNAGITVPKTILAPKTFSGIGYPHTDFLEEVAKQLGFPMVVKECFGSFGQQVYLSRSIDELIHLVLSLAGTPLLFQQFIAESAGRDTRINIVGGRVIASILRESVDGDFRSNLTRGGRMAAYTPTEAEAAIAIKAAEALKLDFCGVDVLFGKDGPIICEVNSNAHFKTTLTCTGINMADEILRHIAQTL